MPKVLAIAVANSVLFTLACLGAGVVHSQERAPLPDLTGIVKDAAWAKILGKALFWDTVAVAKGSDCGSCHFATGANRLIPDQSAAPVQLRRAGTSELVAPGEEFNRFRAGDGEMSVDACTRRMNPRQAELADSGPADKTSALRIAATDPACKEDVTGRLAKALLEHRPLAARTIDPDDNTFGRSGPYGNLVSPTGRGLDRTYQWMIQQAFDENLWQTAGAPVVASDGRVPHSSGEYGRVERNFPLFWGIAIMVYESTLAPGWTHPQRELDHWHSTFDCTF